MAAIILESVLFVGLVAALAALLFLILYHLTPIGPWLRQSGNRRRIERAAELTCPIHGMHTEDELVRLPDGQRVCPACFKEIVDGHAS